MLFLELARLEIDTNDENDYREDFSDYQIQRIDKIKCLCIVNLPIVLLFNDKDYPEALSDL